MDINQILLLIAVLNLIGDLYNIIRFRKVLPTWVLPANLLSLAGCAVAYMMAPDIAGTIAIGFLIAYVVAIRVLTRSRRIESNTPHVATSALIALNLCSYALQVYRNAVNDPYEIMLLGGLYSPLLEMGEWWRLFSAQFLHWGLTHLFLNMLGLWFIGRTVEGVLGRVRFIAAYLLCGAGGMAIAWSLATYGSEPRTILLVGASASVLGLVGLQAAFAFKSFRYSGSLVAKAQLSAMTQIIVLQAIFDWMVPEVSSTAHIGGALSGFILGMLFVKTGSSRSQVGA
jgi:membrane associated rhomboid family serine protease